jgi:hypothetical protein
MKDDDRLLAKAAGVSAADWRDLRTFVLRGWRKASDGRLYHPVVSEKALEAWIGRLSHQRRSALANAARHGGEAEVTAFEDRIRDGLRRLRVLNPKAAADIEKGLKFLQGGSGSPTRSQKPSLLTEKPSQGTGTGRGTADEEEPLVRGSMPDAASATGDNPPEGEAAGSGKSTGPAPASAPPPKKVNPKAGTSRISEDWLADDALREWAKVELGASGWPNEAVDLNRHEDAFRDFWLASSKPEAFKKDWRAGFRTWVRNEIKFGKERGNARANSTGPRRGGVHDPERLRAFIKRG